ncbi:MAG: phosphoribosylformylglycinamidine synthase subunit PurL [Chloroflexota bacterium]|nr:phosphoribosylformylglycinamidine synthase subunit PurL [Chloroflexota bacterium]
MLIRVEIRTRAPFGDRPGQDLAGQIANLGIQTIRTVHAAQLYFIRADWDEAQMRRCCQELLIDPLVQEYSYWMDEETVPRPKVALPEDAHVVEVIFKPGVTDNLAQDTIRGLRTLGLGKGVQVRTGQRFTLLGPLTEGELERISRRALCNPLIQTYTFGPIAPAFAHSASTARPWTRKMPLREADDEKLMEISHQSVLALDLQEMRAIQDHFRRQGRNPTDVELETLAQTWSEHCGHKTFKAMIQYEERGGRTEIIDGLLRTYLRQATEQIEADWVLSAFVDDAGVIRFDDEYEVSFKVETHNHPSALEPFGGANTGTGGVIRDILGVSAQPIGATDVLCFGPLDLDWGDLPPQVLHPRRVFDGVVSGIGDYGNKMGIPTLSGALLFDPGYIANPLVYCGCVGLAPRGSHPQGPRARDLILLIGGRTGRDGIHGATFSSLELTSQTGEDLGSAVQIGNPIEEKKFTNVILQARDRELYSAITDCGGGGLSSAVGEMGAELGVEVALDKVPLKYAGLKPWEIWLSEAQERMILAVPPKNLTAIRELFGAEDVETTVIGSFTGDGRLHLTYRGETVADMEMEFLHRGQPRQHLRAEWHPPDEGDPDLVEPADLTPYLLEILADPNAASKESVVRRYDHEVQGRTVGKPLVGARDDGPADAAVLQPRYDSTQGVVISCGINPRQGMLDPYWMAMGAIDEAVRNAVAVGGDPDHTAILDNFCWGNPRLPDRLGDLIRAAKGCYDGAISFGTPFISGKDSLNNEYRDTHSGELVSIPPTLLISAISLTPDVRRTVSMDLKQPGNLLYLMGETEAELGGSYYYKVRGVDGGRVPRVDPPSALARYRVLFRAVKEGLILSAHDCSEGGLGVALAEMVIAGRLGAEVDLRTVPGEVGRSDHALFSESHSRLVVEVALENAAAFEEAMAEHPCARIGAVTEDRLLCVTGLDGGKVVDVGVEQLRAAWQALSAQPLRETEDWATMEVRRDA